MDNDGIQDKNVNGGAVENDSSSGNGGGIRQFMGKYWWLPILATPGIVLLCDAKTAKAVILLLAAVWGFWGKDTKSSAREPTDTKVAKVNNESKRKLKEGNE